MFKQLHTDLHTYIWKDIYVCNYGISPYVDLNNGIILFVLMLTIGSYYIHYSVIFFFLLTICQVKIYIYLCL